MRGKRVRLEDGIYRDAIGLAAVVTVARQREEKRFALDTDLQQLRIWRADTTSTLLKRARLTSDRGTLARDIAKYLRTRLGRPSYKSDRSHFKPWIVAFGARTRHQIQRREIEQLIASWRCSPRTIRHRVRVLRELYEGLDPTWPHPLQHLKLPRPARTTPMPISHDLIERVAASLIAGKSGRKGFGWEPVKSRARFLVYATCGQRPAQIGRAMRDDVDLERRLWFVRPAKGGDPIVLPLSDDMIWAWEVFIAADAWGTFDTRSLARVLRRHGWPKGLRPYRMRHTFAIDLLLAGVPLDTLQGLLGHLDIRTTRIYAPVQLALSQRAIEQRPLKLRERLDARGVPRAVPQRSGTGRKRLNKNGTGWTDSRTKKKAAS